MFAGKQMTLGRQKVLEIPIKEIIANPEQPRKVFREEELTELTESIRELGVLQPLLVKKRQEGGYFLIAGERRLRAATRAGLQKVPALVKEADEREIAVMALVENVQRSDLNYIEEALAYRSLMQEFGLTQSEIARKVGKKQSTVSNKIRLLVLPEKLQLLLAENDLTERHARALLRLRDDSRKEQVLRKVIAHHLNVSQTEKLVDSLVQQEEKERIRKERVKLIDYKVYVNTVKKAFALIEAEDKRAQYFQKDLGDQFEVRILIPKNVV
ncbi:MAG: ParB/RepB/Spo0J family partition protein [Clostridiales bacterium]|nr:ParB/RepB/Spo0J family partition protein [Clostridiales bacterium]